jgi:hypothetical protein
VLTLKKAIIMRPPKEEEAADREPGSLFAKIVTRALHSQPAVSRENCPDESILLALSNDRLPEEEAAQWMHHVGFCPACRRDYADLLQARQLMQTVRDQSPAVPETPVGRGKLLVFAGAIVPLVALFAAFLAWQGTKQVAQERIVLLTKKVQEAETKQQRAERDKVTAQQAAAKSEKEKSKFLAQKNIEIKKLSQELENERKRTASREPSGVYAVNPEASREQAELQRSDGIRGSSPDELNILIEPVASRIFSDRPVFNWKTSSKETYEIKVTNEQNDTVLNPKLVMPPWQPRTPLKRGVTYRWFVRALKGDQRSVIRSFRIISQKEVNLFYLEEGKRYEANSLPYEALRTYKKIPAGTPYYQQARLRLKALEAATRYLRQRRL